MKKKIAYILLMMVAWGMSACSSSKDEPATQPVPQPAPQPAPTPIPSDGSVFGDVPINFSVMVQEHATTRTATPDIVYGHEVTTEYKGIRTWDDIKGTSAADDVGFGVYAIYTGNLTYAQAVNAAATAKAAADAATTAEEIADADKLDNRAERQIVMDNVQVKTTNGTTWTYDNTRFWPANSSNVSFFAYTPYKTAGINYPTSSDIDTSKAIEDFSYVKKENFSAPYTTWNHSTDQTADLLYGVANQSSTDYSGSEFKVEDDDYVDMHRPTDNTLHWKLKHALARARFSIYNYMSNEDEGDGEAIAIGGSGSEYMKYMDGGFYYIDDPENPGSHIKVDLNGYYVHFGSDTYHPNIYHKYSEDTERKVIITDITFENVKKEGKLYLMNDANRQPMWETLSTYTAIAPYRIIPANSDVYSNPVTPGGIADVSVFDNLKKIDRRTESPISLHVARTAGGEIDESRLHYILFMPQEYDEGHDANNIKVTITYQVCTKIVLEGNYTWNSNDQTFFTPPAAYDSTVVTQKDEKGRGVKYQAGELHQLSGILPFSIEANKTYDVVIQLGNIMSITYEITDWDDTHTINLPNFY